MYGKTCEIFVEFFVLLIICPSSTYSRSIHHHHQVLMVLCRVYNYCTTEWLCTGLVIIGCVVYIQGAVQLNEAKI